MQTVLVLLVTIVGSIGAAPESRIVFGKDAQEGQFPHEVSVQWGDGPRMVHICGGAIIAPEWILTAAHCITELPFEGVMRVKAGLTKLDSDDYQEVDVIKRIKHPDYVGSVTPHDIAMLKLEKPLVYNSKVQPIGTPSAGELPSGMATMAGWGQTIPGSNVSNTPNHLQFSVAPVISNDDCRQMLIATLGSAKYLTKTHMCTGPLNNVSMCPGDSGSPLIQEGKVIGVFSWLVPPCGKVPAPSVYSMVSNYIDFIYGEIKQS